MEKEDLARIKLYHDRLAAASGMPDTLTEAERQDLTALLEKHQREQGIVMVGDELMLNNW